MPQLRRFTVENFKCFREPTTFEFSDVNLLYGKNSAGKSSLFDAVEYFRVVLDDGGYASDGWERIQKLFDFRRVVSDHDLGKTIRICADFDFEQHPERVSKVTGEGFHHTLDAMMLVGDLPGSFLASLSQLSEQVRAEEKGKSDLSFFPSLMSQMFLACPPLLLRENVETVGVEMDISWSEEARRPRMNRCKIRVNGTGLIVSSEVKPGRFRWSEEDREATTPLSATATKLNGEHSCLPYVLVDLDRCGKMVEILSWRGDRFQSRRELEQMVHDTFLDDPGETGELPVRDERPNEVTVAEQRSWYSLPYFELDEEAREYAKVKSITSELPDLPGDDEQVQIGKLLWRRPLPSELQTDDDLREAIEHERSLLSSAPKIPPWIQSALSHSPGGLVVKEGGRGMLDLQCFHLDHMCDSRYWSVDIEGEQFWDDEDKLHGITGNGSPDCSKDEKNWNALVYHCWILGHFAIENVREGLRGLGRVPPIRERVSNVSDLGPETTKSINQWLSHDDGFQLGVRIRSTHEVVRDELRNAVESLSGEDAELLTHKLIDLTHRFGRFEDSMLVNQDNLPVRAEEIGTGVSQLIPVVIQAFRGGIQMFEQPELHLHAEPQLVLGDMFLDAKCQAFLETHSLPLLLRIMRRIREQSKRLAEGTGEGEEKADRSEEVTEGDPERLLADAIRVWHIRDHEGSSRAEEIRIDNEGMLIDDWPDDLFDVKFREVFGR